MTYYIYSNKFFSSQIKFITPSIWQELGQEELEMAVGQHFLIEDRNDVDFKVTKIT